MANLDQAPKTQDPLVQTEHFDGDSSSFLFENLILGWQQFLGNIKHSYATAADNYIDEIFITASQQQINDALYQYVTKNLGFLHILKLDLHDGWLRLTCTIDILGIYATVASNFELVHIELNKHRQRLVLKQISDTDVIELHTRQWYKAPLAKFAVKAYRALLRKDPLPFILNQIKIGKTPFTEHKGNVIYLDIGRWLKNSQAIMDNLKKAQVNGGTLKQEQLILKVQPNFGEILSFGNKNTDIITDSDAPTSQAD